MNSKIFSTFTRLMLRLALGLGATSMASTAYAVATFQYGLDASVSVSGNVYSDSYLDWSYSESDSSSNSNATAAAGENNSSTGAWISGSGTANPDGYAYASSDASWVVDIFNDTYDNQLVTLTVDYDWLIDVSADDFGSEFAGANLYLQVYDDFFDIDEFVLLEDFVTPPNSNNGDSGYQEFSFYLDSYDYKTVYVDLFGLGDAYAKVPEPGSLVLLFAGLLGFCWFTRTDKHQAPLIG